MAERNLVDAVKKFAADLAEKIDTFVDDASELEVRTYTTPSDQVAILLQNRADLKTEGQVVLRAYTRVAFDGDMSVCVPLEASGETNKAVWDLHQGIVEQAMANRATMIQAVGEAALSALRELGLANQ
jgi:hypothetical protein